MSDTPRTDKLARGNHVVPTEWAEDLERELNKAREALRDWAWWAESISRRVTEDRDSINWTGLQQARKALADIQKEAK